MKQKLLTLLTFLLCVVASAWATEETVSLKSHELNNGKAVLNTESAKATVTVNMTPATNDRGIRWQSSNNYIQIEVAEGNKINSVKLTSNSQGNNVTDITYTLTEGSANDSPVLSGTWDNQPNAGKKADYTWTASSGTYYRTWYLNKTNSKGDIYIASITINYEAAVAVNAAPVISTQPASALKAYVGFESTLSVAATGYPTPTYQWYSNTTATNSGGTPIEGATSSSYSFTPSEEGTLYFYVVAKNNYDEADHTATSEVSTVTVGTQYSVAYSKGETGATVANTMASTYYDKGASITLPKNNYFYLAGSSVSKWSDGTNEYDLNSSYTVNSDVVFNPVFATNSKSLGDEETFITWTFAKSAGAPVYAIEGDGKSCSVIGTTANGIDLKMDVTLSKPGSDVGKFNNSSRPNDAQVNKYSSFTIPALQGMTVTYTGTNGTAAATDEILFGEDKATSVSGSTYTYIYNGTASTLTITDNKGGLYPSGITASYPKVIPEPAAAEASGTVLTYTNGSVNNKVWTGTQDTECEGYSITANSNNIGAKSSTKFALTAGDTYTIAVPSGVTITSFKITGAANSSTSDVTYNEIKKSFSNSGDSEQTWTVASPSAGGSIVFSVATKQLNITSITLYANDITLTTTTEMAGWRSFYDATNDYTADANTIVYVVKAKSGIADQVVLSEYGSQEVPKNHAFILKTSADNRTITLTKTSELEFSGDNLLKASTAGQNLEGVYRLGANDSEVGFFEYTTASAAAGIVYLDTNDVNTSNGAKTLAIVFDNKATGINGIEETSSGKTAVRKIVKNGQLVIETANGSYTVSGARLK